MGAGGQAGASAFVMIGVNSGRWADMGFLPMVCVGGRVAIRNRSRKTGVMNWRELRTRDGAPCDSDVDSKRVVPR